MVRAGERMQAEIMTALRQGQKAMTAYDLLSALRPAHPKIAPPTVYRALAKLVEGGAIHRLESLNAYIACSCTGEHDAAILSICDDCGAVEESAAPDVFAALTDRAAHSGFRPTRHVVELHGVCAACRDGEARV